MGGRIAYACVNPMAGYAMIYMGMARQSGQRHVMRAQNLICFVAVNIAQHFIAKLPVGREGCTLSSSRYVARVRLV